jgi:hypothetical protein
MHEKNFPLRIGWGEGSRVRWLLRSLCSLAGRIPCLLFVSFACFAVPAPATVFTTNLTLTETNFAYDGQDIVIDGATVAIDGPHAFHSLLQTRVQPPMPAYSAPSHAAWIEAKCPSQCSISKP